MLGGTVVNFIGPCLSPDSIIECNFHDQTTKGVYRSPNFGSCIMPPVMYHGYVDFHVRIDGHTTFHGRFYVRKFIEQSDERQINA